MSDYIDKAQADIKKLMVDQIMQATRGLVAALKESYSDKKIWAGYRKKLRRIL